ncbi:prevent-host-death protein [Nocardia sp. NEAU-G5]|uniref:Prevent-host-death protein n=1 Tax=Nocardia albiluteola TaxID=2842303 RepID=A0ABS6AUW2_9NOCA|nr:prevent-host-death protein [Nocardia albiluteola]MBU3061809.1 prevent-host-death protein [Nocardia albiluteola]
MSSSNDDDSVAARLEPMPDVAAAASAATVRSGAGRMALVDAEFLRTALTALCPSPVEVARENGSWSATVRGLPIAAAGTDIDTVVDELIAALRAQTANAPDRLRDARNHYGEWVLRQLIQLSDDAQLREWAMGGACVHLQ